MSRKGIYLVAKHFTVVPLVARIVSIINQLIVGVLVGVFACSLSYLLFLDNMKLFVVFQLLVFLVCYN